MNVALMSAILIAAAALIGAWLTLRTTLAHRAIRIALQLVAAVLIYFTLFPPNVDERFAAGTLVVLTPGTSEQQIAGLARGNTTVALPDVVAGRDVERVPDLGTALRRHPDSAHLRIIGGGLPPRDIDAARALAIDFEPTLPANGIVGLSTPGSVRAGSTFSIGGRVQGNAGGRVELLDPAGAVAAQATLAEDGAFALNAPAKTAGNFLFSLRVLDKSGAHVETLSQPLAVLPGDALRVLVLAGAPDPELKYLRRWAADAGVELTSRIVLSDGIAINDGKAELTAEALARTDVAVVDERAWKGLDANTRTLLKDATREGLGLFLRVTGTLPDGVADDWRGLGFRVRPGDVAQTVSLASTGSAPNPAAVLSRRALLVEADDAAPLLRDSGGSSAALWRNDGRGRVAMWWLADTYRLALAGDAATFGTLWSGALATIARPRGASRAEVPTDARVDQRSVLCGLDEGASIEEPAGVNVALSIDAAESDRRCAAFWPSRAGWHTLVSGGRREAFYASATDEAPALAAARNADATRALAQNRVDRTTTTATRGIPAPRWPFFVAWLAVVVALWWLERSKARVVA